MYITDTTSVSNKTQSGCESREVNNGELKSLGLLGEVIPGKTAKSK